MIDVIEILTHWGGVHEGLGVLVRVAYGGGRSPVALVSLVVWPGVLGALARARFRRAACSAL